MKAGICGLCDTPRRWNRSVSFSHREMVVGAQWGEIPGHGWELRLTFLGLRLRIWWGCP